MLRQNKVKKSSTYWVALGRQKSLEVFHQAARRVPAYKDFLKKNHIKIEKIISWDDFQKVPKVDKKNYLGYYPLNLRAWDGTLKRPMVFTATSGSTGGSVYFPRGRTLDRQYAEALQGYIEASSFGKEGSTLVVVCFGMGIWIGGLITYQAFEIAANKNKFPVSIVTPGINKGEIIKALSNLAPMYDQIVLVGYAPFIKDLLGEAKDKNIPLSKMNIRFLFAAEAISEKFRDYLKTVVPKINLFRDTMNVYGSADIGAMAFEGPAGIFLKRTALNNQRLFKTLFGNTQKTPTIAQYNPSFINFEADQREILLTGDNEIPLIRYSIGDRGGVFSYDTMEQAVQGVGIDPKSSYNKLGISGFIEKKPFVYLFERADFSVTLYGINIYPEYIKEALLQKSIVNLTTGKFVLETVFDKKQNQCLKINIELTRGTKKSHKLELLSNNIIENGLLLRSSEYRELKNFVKNRPLIKVIFWPSESSDFFKAGIKQKWVIK